MSLNKKQKTKKQKTKQKQNKTKTNKKQTNKTKQKQTKKQNKTKKKKTNETISFTQSRGGERTNINSFPNGIMKNWTRVSNFINSVG